MLVAVSLLLRSFQSLSVLGHKSTCWTLLQLDLVSCLDNEKYDWVALLNKLQTFRLNNKDGVFVWMLENDGSFWLQIFLVKLSAKQIALERQNFDLIWKAFCPKKVKVCFVDILFWKVKHLR